MSRKMTRALLGVMDLAMGPLSPRQRAKTMAGVAVALGSRGTRILETRRGDLTLYAARSPDIASAVTNFATDEPETLAWIDEFVQPGDTLWDIGASIGLYSLYAALRPAVRVVAFEPKAVTFGLLVEHIALNGLDDRVQPFCLALGAAPGIATLHIPSLAPGGAGNSIAGAWNQFGPVPTAFKQAVPALSADAFRRLFALPPPDHVKLDVDGVEPEILAGAAETLRAVRTMLIEVEGRNAERAGALIEAPLAAAGLAEDIAFRARQAGGRGRNRLYVRSS